MLQKQNIAVTFAQGVDLKADPKQVIQGKLLSLENGTLQNIGKIIKRTGFDALSNTLTDATGIDALSGGEALGTFDNELLLFNKNRAYSRADFNSSYTAKGHVVPVVVSNETIIRNTFDQAPGDFAIVNGVSCYAWKDSRDGIRIQVIDINTGTVFQAETLLNANGIKPRVRAVGGFLIIFYQDTVANALKFTRINSANPYALLTEQTLVAATSGFFDLQTTGNLAFWATSLNNNTIQAGFVDNTGSILAGGQININEKADNCVGVYYDDLNAQGYVFWYNAANGTRVAGFEFDPGMVPQVLFAPTTIDASVINPTNNITATLINIDTYQIFYHVVVAPVGSIFTDYVKKAKIDNGGTVTGVGVLQKGVALFSKAFTVGDFNQSDFNANIDNMTAYVKVLHSSTLQSTYFLIDSNGNVAGKALPGLGGAVEQSYLPQMIETSSGMWSGVTPYASVIQANNITSDQSSSALQFRTKKGIKRTDYAFESDNRYFSKQLSKSLLVAGGHIANYDANSIVEHAFHLFPENISAVVAVNGGHITATGASDVFTYQVVYTWTDNKGQIHRSIPSIPLAVSGLDNSAINKVTLTIPTLRLTAKTSPRSEVIIEVYRTTINGTVFHLTGTVVNDPTRDTVLNGFVDINSDATISVNQLLYTTGGVLPNVTPPAAQFITASKSRIFLTGLEDPFTIWYSQEFQDNEAIRFHDSYIVRVDPSGGPITGIATMDFNVIIGQKDRLSFISGQGPLQTGAQNDFSDPQLISSDVGVVDPNSFVLMSQGLCFKSAKGIYLLSRSLQLSYIGASVEAYNSFTVVSSDLIASKNQVKFLLADGPALVWDYFRNEWYTAANHAGLDSTIWQDNYVYLRTPKEQTNGQTIDIATVFQENRTHYLDGSSSIPMTVETAWIKLSDIQGFQRVRRVIFVGDHKSDHKLQIQVYYDYKESVSSVYIWDPSTALDLVPLGNDPNPIGNNGDVIGGAPDFNYQVRIHLSTQKCQAIKFKITDLMNGTYGESFSLSHLMLEVGVKKGLNKLAPAKSI